MNREHWISTIYNWHVGEAVSGNPVAIAVYGDMLQSLYAVQYAVPYLHPLVVSLLCLKAGKV